MIEIYANDKLLELGKIKIEKVFQINNIGDPKDRQLDYTLPFDIPITPKNILTLEMLGINGNLSRVPYKQIKAKLIENSIEIIPDGVLVITKKQGKFKGYIYGGNFFLFDKIGSKKLNELNFSNLNHGVNLDNFINSFNNNDGYIYGISDFGKLDTTEIEINYQVPSIYVHTIWNKIFEDAGIKFYGDIFENIKFKSKVITMHRGYNSELDVITTPINITATSQTENITFNAQYPNINVLPFFYPSQPNINSFGDPTGAEINPIDSGTYDYNFNLHIAIGNKNLSFLVFFDIVESSTNNIIQSRYLTFLSRNDIFTTNIQGSCVLDGSIDYVILIRYIFSYSNTETPPIENDIQQTFSDFSLKNSTTLTSLRFNEFIGELSQIDFVKDIMQEFGLICKKRRNELAYDFIQIKTLLSDRTNTLDWSDKLVGEISETYTLNSYAKSNRFAYNYLKNDEDKFADGILIIDNENLPSEKTLVTRPYNAPKLTEKNIEGNNLLYIPFWNIEFNEDGSVKGYKPFQSKNYILDIIKIYTTVNYKFTNRVVQSYTGNVPILDFTNLKYSQLLNENYKELKETLDYNHIKLVELSLNELDIQNLDLFKPIFLKQFSSDFYINKIKYVDSSIKSIAELVKIKRSLV